MDFTNITMWIQLHNLPLACMSRDIVKRIGEKVGTVVEVDSGEGDQCWGKFARVRVTRSIHEPLVRGIPIEAEDTHDPMMVIVLYERLPDLFCFACGRIGHHLKKCDADAETKATLTFGSWLRAGRGMEYRKPSNFTEKKYNPRPNPNGPRPPPRDVQPENMTIGRLQQ